MASSEPYNMGTHSFGHGDRTRSTSRKPKPWKSRLSLGSKHKTGDSEERLDRTVTAASVGPEPWWKINWFEGMANDLRRRAPFYLSDWVDALDYRVVPATIYMYFANILPALAFSLDMFAKTNMSFGVNEVLLSSVLAAVVFSTLACQPLVIVGVTGPITVFNYTIYDIVVPRGTNFFSFLCWVSLWSLVMHWILAITNACNGLKYVTRFSCDIFGFYVAFIYLQKGIQVLTRQWEAGDTSAYLSIMVSLLVLMCAYICGVVGESTLFQRHVRKFIEDYGTPLTVIFFTGFVHIGKMENIELLKLPTGRAFFPTSDRGWLVHFWEIDVGDVFIAIPFAMLLTILFYFDHNGEVASDSRPGLPTVKLTRGVFPVSSLIAQGTEFPLRKPAGFHWDIFLLGLTTGVAGLLGLPQPNGLIPQAPFHTNSLCVTRTVTDEDEANKGHTRRVVDHVVEQRFSNLAQGLLTLGTMTGPLLVVLGLIPQAVMAGLFFVMGIQALEGNGITQKMVFLAKDKSLTGSADPLKRISRRGAIWAFVALELVGFGATFAITQTIAAIGFPVFILLLIPARIWLLPRYFTREELAILDAPTASPFTMESVGGHHGDIADVMADETRSFEGSIIEEGDEAERGEAKGGNGGGLTPERTESVRGSVRRTSFRSEGEEIELAGVGRSRRRPGSRSRSRRRP
ncbi:HCO3 transporter family protein [Lineolata rhizophorae]|uniref:HCO3 transporter family protein n=1 Tax=Lineolata rhizophorae TaxID=578093 RepID=A0A6A6NWK0_9PEZI|nr:HCO3 transporter family protein [Lineolata rhizophorae]